MTKDDAIAFATAGAAQHQAPVEVWEHRLQGRFVTRPASRERPKGAEWVRRLRVNQDGTQVQVEDLPAKEVFPPDDFTIPMVLTASEAVYGFAAWLTTRPDAVTFGAQYDAAIAAEVAAYFCRAQGLGVPRQQWERALKPSPKPKESKANG